MANLIPQGGVFAGLDRLNQALDQRFQNAMTLRQMQETKDRNAMLDGYAKTDRKRQEAEYLRQQSIRNAMGQPYQQQTGGPLMAQQGQDYQPVSLETMQPNRENVMQRLQGLGEWEQALKLMPEQKPAEGFSLKPEEIRFDASGKEIARGGDKAQKFDAFVDKIDMGDKVRAWKPDGTYQDFPKTVSPSTVFTQDTRRASDEMGIRKEFLALPEVKAHVEISSQVQRLDKAMQENAKGGSKVAVDQALITILNKMLDPSSVVRESEYARTPGDMAFLNRMRGKVEKLKTGGAGLTDEDRTAIATMARTFSDVSQGMYNEQEQYYSGLSKRYGYNPENVVRLGGPKAREKSPPPKSKELKSGDVEDGYRYVGGDKANPASWKKVQ